MESTAKPIPEGYHTATPYLTVSEATSAIEFYKQAFGATETMRLTDDNGKVIHAEIEIGDSPIMIGDEFPEWGNHSPQSLGGSPVSLYLYVKDVDAVANKAVTAGATVCREVANLFYGDRAGTLIDPFGHIWTIATRQENVPLEEIKKRMAV